MSDVPAALGDPDGLNGPTPPPTRKGKAGAANRGNAQELIKLAMAGRVKLAPDQTTRLRTAVTTIVSTHLRTAEEVIDGRKSWSPVQARVFLALMGKVIPDVSHHQHEHRVTVDDLGKLSREQLEALAAAEDDIIDVTPVDQSEEPTP